MHPTDEGRPTLSGHMNLQVLKEESPTIVLSLHFHPERERAKIFR